MKSLKITMVMKQYSVKVAVAGYIVSVLACQIRSLRPSLIMMHPSSVFCMLKSQSEEISNLRSTVEQLKGTLKGLTKQNSSPVENETAEVNQDEEISNLRSTIEQLKSTLEGLTKQNSSPTENLTAAVNPSATNLIPSPTVSTLIPKSIEKSASPIERKFNVVMYGIGVYLKVQMALLEQKE